MIKTPARISDAGVLDDEDAGAWLTTLPRAGVLLSTLLPAVALPLTLPRAGVFVCRGAAHFWLLGTKTVTVLVVVLFEPSVQATVMV